MKIMLKRIKKNWSLMIVGVYLLTITLYIIYRQEDIIIRVHDNLDAWQGQYAAIKNGHLIFGEGAMPFLHGMDRDYFPSELKVYSWPYFLFDGFYAMVINYYLRIIFSVVGIWWLLKNVLNQDDYIRSKHIIFLIGFLYGIIPVCPIWYVAVGIIPYTVAEIYRIYKYRKVCDIVILFLIPYFSELAHFGIFICAGMLCILLLSTIYNKKINLHLLCGLVAHSIGYVVSEYRMFRLIFIKNASTIRISMGDYDQSLYTIAEGIKQEFLLSDYYVDALQSYLILPLTIAYILYIIVTSIKKRRIVEAFRDQISQLILIIFLNCIICGLYEYKPFTDILYSLLPVFKGIDFSRIVRLNAFLWYMVFAVLLIKLRKNNHHIIPYTLIMMSAITVLIMPSVSRYNFLRTNILREYYEMKGIPNEDAVGFSFEEFFSEALFEEIKRDIDYHGEWVAAYGMHPSILSYNNFATIDGYHSWYSDEYREKFRELIAPDFETDIAHKNYFDFWAGRAYLYSEVMGYADVKDLGVSSAELKIDKNVFKELEGRYILSRVIITNADALDLILRGIYSNDDSPYTIYTYEMIY